MSVPTAPKLIDVVYKCKCFDKEHHFMLPERAADENVVDFMGRVQRGLSTAHAAISPKCQEAAMEYVKIPYKDDKPLGAVVNE